MEETGNGMLVFLIFHPALPTPTCSRCDCRSLLHLMCCVSTNMQRRCQLFLKLKADTPPCGIVMVLLSWCQTEQVGGLRGHNSMWKDELRQKEARKKDFTRFLQNLKLSVSCRRDERTSIFTWTSTNICGLQNRTTVRRKEGWSTDAGGAFLHVN